MRWSLLKSKSCQEWMDDCHNEPMPFVPFPSRVSLTECRYVQSNSTLSPWIWRRWQRHWITFLWVKIERPCRTVGECQSRRTTEWSTEKPSPEMNKNRAEVGVFVNFLSVNSTGGGGVGTHEIRAFIGAQSLQNLIEYIDAFAQCVGIWFFIHFCRFCWARICRICGLISWLDQNFGGNCFMVRIT